MTADGTIGTVQNASENVQAHLLRSAKRAGKKPRDWLLFFFFRILDDEQIKATKDRIKTCPEDPAHQEALWLDFAHPALLHAQRRSGDPGSVNVFRDWLKMIACADSEPLLKQLRDLAETAPSKAETPAGTEPNNTLLTWVERSFQDGKLTPGEILEGVTLITKLALGKVAGRLELLEACRAAASQIGALPALTLFEVLRQAGLSIAHAGDENQAALRSDAAGHAPSDERPLPVNLAFTHSGLTKLQLNALTLASFPDAFKQGMADRAARLHDTGPSAPGHWEGELGLPSIHGYFSGGGGFSQNILPEDFWRDVRRDVAAFNDPVDEKGAKLRYWMSLLFRGLGMEIAHIELGQDPYSVEAGSPVTQEPRVEHFGFRDGLSQPFVDLGLAAPPPGGGRPLEDGTWGPIATGEIFLNQNDVKGAFHKLPISAELRVGSTFLVFRKLEQDVDRFRTFLASQRPGSADAQEKLAAQMMGRWPDGAPLVLYPDAPPADGAANAATLNDFRYAGADLKGGKCPLAAHVRRTNPRDLGGRDAASRHRILRRSISYGGPLLARDGSEDGETQKRGLLFVAANARIDVQFEVIQSEWMNGGEFLGQAGLGRCPVLGAHNGKQTDSFLEVGAVAPVTGLPRFVITRGGDYFFAPGVPVVKTLAQTHGETFAPKPEELPFDGYALGDCSTPGLFAHERLDDIGLASGQLPRLRIATPNADEPELMVFVARHVDVLKILRGDGRDFSVRHYREAANQMTGEDMLIGTDTADPTPSSRERLSLLLGQAWRTLAGGAAARQKTLPDLLRESVRERLSSTIAAIAEAGPDARRIDLLEDLAVPATYAMIAEVFGVPGPSQLSDLTAAMPFGRLRLREVPDEWLALVAGAKPGNPGQTTLRQWSILILADLIGNLQVQATLRNLSRIAGAEMLRHVRTLLDEARSRMELALLTNGRLDEPTTLLEAFVYNAVNDKTAYAPGSDAETAYYRQVSVLLLELVGTSMATIPLTFASVMSALFDFRIDLASLVPLLEGDPPTGPLPDGEPNGLQRLIYEAERLNPNAAVRMRYCVADASLSNGAKLKAGEWAACLISAANLDEKVFPNARHFSLSPYVDPTGPVRDWTKYLLFGEDGSVRRCWGRDRVAMVALEECLRAAARLKRLRRPAGLGGRPKKMGSMTISLPARFTRVD